MLAPNMFCFAIWWNLQLITIAIAIAIAIAFIWIFDFYHLAVTSTSRSCDQKSYTVGWQLGEERSQELK